MTMPEILQELRIDFVESGNQHSRPGWIQLQSCPMCGSSKYHLGYNLNLKYFSCWKCGGHHLVKILTALGVARSRAEEIHRSVDTSQEISHEIARISLKIPAGLGPLGPPHRRYLRNRGFEPDEVERIWSLKGISLSTKLAWRIYIPIFEKGRQVSWTTRAIGPRVEQRYVSASAEQESKNHKHVVYGSDFCFHSIIVVEGPTDAWNVGPGAGAVFGTAFSTAQIKRILDFPHRFICFDSSPDAQARAEEMAHQLSAFPGATENIVLDAEDPGSASKKEIKLLRKVAKL